MPNTPNNKPNDTTPAEPTLTPADAASLRDTLDTCFQIIRDSAGMHRPGLEIHRQLQPYIPDLERLTGGCFAWLRGWGANLRGHPQRDYYHVEDHRIPGGIHTGEPPRSVYCGFRVVTIPISLRIMPPPNREPRTFKTFELVDEVDSEESRQINGMRGGLPSGANQGIPTAYPKSTIPRETEHRMGVIWPDMKPTVFDTRYSPAPMISVDQYLERTRRPDLGSLGNLFRDWLHCAERQAEASQRVTTTPAPAGRKRMSADKARVKAEQYVTRHGFPGVNKLADDVGCSPATIRNAISNSEKLQTAKAESDLKKTPSGRGGTGDYAQSPEANLVGAERLRELLGYASPDDRAKLNAPNMATRLGGMTHDEYNAILQSVKEKNAEASEDA